MQSSQKGFAAQAARQEVTNMMTQLDNMLNFHAQALKVRAFPNL